MNNKYTYLVYGLIVESHMEFKELMKYDNAEKREADVNIVCKTMPEDIKESLEKGQADCFTKEKAWFLIKHVAVYYIKDAGCIEFEPFPEADPHKIKSFLLGSAFGMLLILRKSIAIHGGSITIGEKGIILTGGSGAGKSTLTAAFREKGYDFLADDVSVLGEDKNHNIVVMPGYPQQKLCRDAVEKFKYSNLKNIRKINEDRDKYALALENQFRKNSAALKAIYELSVGNVDKVKAEKITGREKLNVILKNIYRVELANYIGIDPVYFKKCLQLAKNIQVYRIVRPKEGYTIDQQVEIIEASI